MHDRFIVPTLGVVDFDALRPIERGGFQTGAKCEQRTRRGLQRSAPARVRKSFSADVTNDPLDFVLRTALRSRTMGHTGNALPVDRTDRRFDELR